MPLTPVVAGQQTAVLQLNQLINLLTGVMTDQAVTIANAFVAKTVGASGAPSLGSAATTKFVGRWTTTGAPTGLTPAAGDYGIDGANTWWYYTGSTWIQMSPPPNTSAANVQPLGASAVAGASGLAGDAAHVHAWTGLGVLSVAGTWSAAQTFNNGASIALATLLGLTGAANNWRVGGALSAQARGVKGIVPASGTWSTGDLVADLKAFLWMCRAGGTPGTWNVIPRGWGAEPQTFFTANTRSDLDAVDGDILLNG